MRYKILAILGVIGVVAIVVWLLVNIFLMALSFGYNLFGGLI